jgi:hypothetical protein
MREQGELNRQKGVGATVVRHRPVSEPDCSRSDSRLSNSARKEGGKATLPHARHHRLRAVESSRRLRRPRQHRRDAHRPRHGRKVVVVVAAHSRPLRYGHSRRHRCANALQALSHDAVALPVILDCAHGAPCRKFYAHSVSDAAARLTCGSRWHALGRRTPPVQT